MTSPSSKRDLARLVPLAMKPYKNLNSDSGVIAYEIADKSITIKFRDGGKYLYDYVSPGQADVDEMKRLALAGKGLATYINAHVRERFAGKL
jgi:hypothetical protein